MNALFTPGLMIDISVKDTTQGAASAHLGMTEELFSAPTFEGDSMRCTKWRSIEV